MQDATDKIRRNLAEIRQRIDQAAQRVGRSGTDVTLVAVCKYVDATLTRTLVEAGCVDVGESRPQELWHKAEALASLDIRWHLVGHLQRNKIRRSLPLVSLIHSGDRISLLEELNGQSQLLQRPTAVLLEVNISGDATKHGFQPDEVAKVVRACEQWPHLEIRGLMGMASREGDLDAARQDFRRLRELRDSLQDATPPTVSLKHLSMGMSGDFEVAVEEGATLVRIGSSLFEGVIDA